MHPRSQCQPQCLLKERKTLGHCNVSVEISNTSAYAPPTTCFFLSVCLLLSEPFSAAASCFLFLEAPSASASASVSFPTSLSTFQIKPQDEASPGFASRACLEANSSSMPVSARVASALWSSAEDSAEMPPFLAWNLPTRWQRSLTTPYLLKRTTLPSQCQYLSVLSTSSLTWPYRVYRRCSCKTRKPKKAPKTNPNFSKWSL
mmetsp:Transcript_6964/g.17501  ORF Transcript_6964/g.17501 Transcript_6964/m.17501 type:complete len:203 (-) Transcript_6964:850-1458(-)